MGLAEVLVALGEPVLNLVWRVDVHDVAPEPGAEELRGLEAAGKVHVLVLLRHSTPDIQILDGSVTGYAREHPVQPVIRISAVDSTS